MQLLVVPVATWVRVQLPPLLKLPVAGPLSKLTVPAGNDLLPPSVSETVAVQVEPWLIATVAGLQLVVGWVERLVTVSANPVASLLSAWMSLAV